MLSACRKRGVPTMLLSGNTILQSRRQSFITQSDGSFKKMGSVKTKFVLDLLQLGVSPILTDADVVWLRDPRPYFDEGNYADADVLISSDCIDIPADRVDKKGCAHVNFNTGVLLLRSRPSTQAFVRSWSLKVRTSSISWMRDQPAFNLLARTGPRGGLLQVNKRRGRALYLSGNETIRMGVLPVWLFTNGHTYFVQTHHRRRGAEQPFSVHLTYQYGDAGRYAYGKRERMRQHGLWRVDSPDFYNGKYISIAPEGAQMPFSGPEEVGWDRKDYRTAIERHLADDERRREVTRNLIGLARALNRTPILPRGRCYCDKIWNNLNGCRAPGAERADLPFECPMDHIYDVPVWYSHDIDFRHASFLEDEKLPPEVKQRRARVRIEGSDLPDKASEEGSVLTVTGPFNDDAARRLFAPVDKHPWVEVSGLGPGTFCGFGKSGAARKFDSAMNAVLRYHTFYCFTEAWDDMGRPMGNPWEPQVVLRHCGKDESVMWREGRITPGKMSYIGKADPPKCSCEWGFAQPVPLGQCTAR
eukprot:Hpha_TRINITY_DN11063_c0_g2::TRINITY_DN11063_c0_g2_i1::g.92856::m.92856/K20784/XEG113; arabinosyltransferase